MRRTINVKLLGGCGDVVDTSSGAHAVGGAMGFAAGFAVPTAWVGRGFGAVAKLLAPSKAGGAASNLVGKAASAYGKATLGAAKSVDEAIAGIGDARSFVTLTKGGSIRNVGTNATHTEFAETLVSGGWISRTSKDGAVQIFQRDGAKYVLRSKNSSGYAGWTADFTPAGSTRHTLEIRLGYMP